MNFFGHAWLAARREMDPAFVFGAMLPDLAAMVRLRVERVDHDSLAAGRGFHLATDAAFHGLERFERLMLDGIRELRAAGVRSGPARAVGHVGVELLLDGWIAERHGVPEPYAPALDRGPSWLPAVAFRGAADPAPLEDLCRRIAGATLPPGDWCAPERLAARLVRILARRPRLAITAAELPALRQWAAGARVAVAREAEPCSSSSRSGWRSGLLRCATGNARLPRRGELTMKIDGALIGADWTRSGEEAALLEAQGFAGAWSFEGQHDPFIPLVLAAERTESIELGTAIAVAFARNPMITAYAATDVHTLSRGRFILGLGSQIRPHIEKRFSQPWSKPVARMREFVLARGRMRASTAKPWASPLTMRMSPAPARKPRTRPR